MLWSSLVRCLALLGVAAYASVDHQVNVPGRPIDLTVDVTASNVIQPNATFGGKSAYETLIDMAREPNLSMEVTEVTELMEKAVREHYLLSHDFLRCFQSGEFTDIKHAVRVFAENHYTYSKNFIRYLRMVADKVREDIRPLLLENISEEDGHYEESDLVGMEENGIPRAWFNEKPHRDLIMKFLLAADVDQSMFNRTDHPGGRFTAWILDQYTKANACEALAIIGFAIEETVSTLYQFLWEGLKKTDMNPEDYVFFPLHILVDDGHADLLKRGFMSYWAENPQQCQRAPALVLEVLDRRSQMLDELRELMTSSGIDTCSLPVNPVRETQLAAINKARKLTAGMRQPTWTLKQKMALSARILAEQGQGKTLSGQISCRDNATSGSNMEMWTQVYGVPLEHLRPHQFIKINDRLEVVEGAGFPNLANRFHLHVYRERPDIQCMVHTHAPWSSALGLTGVPLHIGNMDVMALYDQTAHLPAWPGVPFGDEEGEIIANAIGKNNWAALLGHHGLFVGGRTIEEATYRAYFFEVAAEMQMKAMSVMGGRPLPTVDRATAERAREWRLNAGPVKAHFNSWAYQAIKNGHGDALVDGNEEAAEVAQKLETLAHNHHLLKHPYLRCFQNSGFTDMRKAVRVFAENHYTYSKNFIRYLRMVADKVSNDIRPLLLENISEEDGHYEESDLVGMEENGIPRAWFNEKPHRDLIMKFLLAADVDQSMFNRTDHPGGRFTAWILDQYTKANACEALAVIGFAIEETVSTLYQFLWEGLKKTDMNPEDYVFFPLHILVDDGHADLLKRGFMSYWAENPIQCQRAPQLIQEVLDRRSQMLDELVEIMAAEEGSRCSV